MGFFSSLFGFSEQRDYASTQKQLLDMAQFQSIAGACYPREQCDFKMKDTTTVSAGIFSMPSVAELVQQVDEQLAKKTKSKGSLSVKNMVGEARALHEAFPGAIIQAASQFNMLEFPSPTVIPEQGISGYVHDRTQGPACAVACAAGTAYRNYLVPVPFPGNVKDTINSTLSQRGQNRKSQLDGLVDLEQYLQTTYSDRFKIPPWKITNGYIESAASRIQPLNDLLQQDDHLQTKLESMLRVGIQEDTTVTDIPSYNVKCTQVYSSAVAVGYSRLPTNHWEPLARLVLNATYKATLLVGVLKNLEEKNSSKPIPILLTKVGGGVFQNKDEWILEAISKAINHVSKYNVDLDIRIVHFGAIDGQYEGLERDPAGKTDEL